jgi:hypothetical protein
MKCWLCLLLTAASVAFAQDSPKLRDALEWTTAQRGRMNEMTNRVVRVHGTASLAAVVCAEDRSAGAGLYRDAIGALHNLPQDAFTGKGTTVLPVASFTGLWKYVIPAAVKCDPALAEAAANQRSRERLEAERAGANATLKRAWELIDPSQVLDKQDNNDRAAQIARAALEAGDPETFDFDLLVEVMSQLNEKAPDLADDLFVRALEFAMSSQVPDPGAVQEIAEFVFQADTPNPDNIEALIDKTVRLFDIPASIGRNPASAYGLGMQLLPWARDLAPDQVGPLQAALANLAAQDAAAVAQTQASQGTSANPAAQGGPLATADYLVSGQIQRALSGGQVEAARDLLPRINDPGARSQLGGLIAFGEAVRAIEARSEQALVLANLLRGGIKRSLLYASIAGSTTRLDLALQEAPLATRDIASLPAEQRVQLLSALAASLARIDPQSAMATLDLLVRAYNDVYVSPRRGKFDPRATRASTDSPLILAGPRGLYEAVQTGRGRRNFVLKAPGVTALDIGNFLLAASSIEPERLESVILGLRDENTRAGALVRLAEVRIRAARSGR